MTAVPKVDDVIQTYIKLRTQKEELEAGVKTKLKDIKEKMSKLEQWIQTESDRTGIKSFKTDHGTAFVTTSDFASVSDWNAVLDFARDNDAFDILTRSVSKVAVRGYIDANKEVPPGITFGTKIGVSVRRPTKKA